MVLRNSCLIFGLISCSCFANTKGKKYSIHSKATIVHPSKETETLWKYAEKNKAKAFILAYINKGGNLKLTNEYGETVVKILIKNCTQTKVIPAKPVKLSLTNNRTSQPCSLSLNALLIASTAQ